MAEKEKEELEKGDQEHLEEEGPKRKKVPINLIIICILGLCLLGGGFYIWKSGLLSSGSDSLDISEEEGQQEIGPTYSMETFIVHLVGGRGKNYLKAKVELELDSDKTTAEINKRLPQIRDAYNAEFEDERRYQYSRRKIPVKGRDNFNPEPVSPYRQGKKCIFY